MNEKTWERVFNKFTSAMKQKIIENIPEKGFSWRDTPISELEDILMQYVEAKQWVSVANLAFMLWEGEG